LIHGKTQWNGERNIMSKSSKYILAVGCSYTDENFKSVTYPDIDCSFDKWPAILGDHLDLVVKNLGLCGAGNDLIFTKALEEIIENHDLIEMVVVGWSEWHRFSTYDHHMHNPESSIIPKDKNLLTEFNREAMSYYEWLWSRELTVHKKFLRKAISSWLKRIVMLQKICDKFGIKHIQATLCGSMNRHNYKKIEDMIGKPVDYEPQKMFGTLLNDPYFYEVNSNHIIGWPFMESMGGFEMNGRDNKGQWIIPFEDRICPPKDHHPGKKGHEIIADFFIKKHQEIYV